MAAEQLASSTPTSRTSAGRPILLVGLPRSGTTWVARALDAAVGVHAVLEPDNEDNYPYAIRAKRGLGRYPIVLPGDNPPDDYVRLWDGAFRGGRGVTGVRSLLSDELHAAARWRTSVHRSQQWAAPRRMMLRTSVALSRPCGPRQGRVVVKTVFAPFALDWLLERWATRMVLVTRSPWSTVASWMRRGWDPPFYRHPVLGWPDVDREILARLLHGRPLPPTPPVNEPVRRLAWELSILMSVVLTAGNGSADRVVIAHEDLCQDPESRFREVYSRLGLVWTDAVTDYLRRSDKPGDGVYDTHRVSREQPSRWRSELTERDAEQIRDVVASFEIDW